MLEYKRNNLLDSQELDKEIFFFSKLQLWQQRIEKTRSVCLCTYVILENLGKFFLKPEVHISFHIDKRSDIFVCVFCFLRGGDSFKQICSLSNILSQIGGKPRVSYYASI